MAVKFQNLQTKEIKEVPEGFSWTTFFFGFFSALFRGDIKWALVMFAVSFITIGISWLVFPFIYNKIYMKELLGKGFIPASEIDKLVIKKYGILIAD